jgi:ribulose 1,5-bisphosphate synthetase/thiazole synthase
VVVYESRVCLGGGVIAGSAVRPENVF